MLTLPYVHTMATVLLSNDTRINSASRKWITFYHSHVLGVDYRAFVFSIAPILNNLIGIYLRVD
jgi:hypothetical protein